MRATQYLALGLGLAAGGCSWFKSESCRQNTTSCDGDVVRACVPDVEASTDRGEPVFHWSAQKKCADDPELGALTCGIVQGTATCVPEPRDGGLADETAADPQTREGLWLRVDVAREGDTLRLSGVSESALLGMPAAAVSGMAAAVSYRDDAIVDATLVPMDAATQSTTVWLRGELATRVALVSEAGTVLDLVAHSTAQPKAGSRRIGGITQGLSAPLPPTLRIAQVEGAQGRVQIDPLLVARIGEHLVAPTAEMLDLVADAFRRIPLAAASVVTDLAFAASENPLPAATQAPPQPAQSPAPRQPRVLRDRTKLLVNVNRELLDEYRRDPIMLTFDLIREIGRAHAEVIYASSQSVLGMKPLSAFPPEIQRAASARFSSMLRPGESFESAWDGLHQIAVDGQLGRSYVQRTLRPPPDDAQAVQEGFASAAGATSPLDDFVEYFARVHVPELWAFGPCADLRSVPLDQLAPARIVPLSKLLVLRGLDLLSAEKLAECAGELRVSTNEPSITMHKANGERLTLTEEIEGIRQPYFDQEVELAWSAKRSYLSLSLSVGYRGYRPFVIRLNPVASHEGKDGRTDDDYAATLAITNPAGGYATSVAQAGLVVVTDVRQDKLDAFALMVRLDREIAGAQVFPLISAQVSKPVWGASIE